MAKRHPKKKAAPAATGNLSHDNATNELSDDQRLALTLQHKKAIESVTKTKKAADADFKNAFKKAKADLGAAGVADIKDMLASENDEHFEAKLQAELERKARLARWLNLDVGTQGGLFDNTTAPSQRDRGYVEGKRAGLSNEVCKPPYGAGTEGYDGYMTGWHDGNAVYNNTIREQSEGAAILHRSPSNEPAGEDAFDKAADGATPAEWPDDKQVAEREAEPA